MKQSIFYIDDEAQALSVFRETFGAEYDVRTATTISEARGMLAERPADIVISDQSMPEISGTEFLREVSECYPSSYRVLLTGSIHLGDVLPEMGVGLVHLFLPKPWTRQDIEAMLERAGIYFELRTNNSKSR